MEERETKLMLGIREKYGGRPLKDILRERYNAVGFSKMAKEFGIGTGTLYYWMLREGLKIERRAVLR